MKLEVEHVVCHFEPELSKQMMDDIQEKWSRLKLTEDESNVLELDGEGVTETKEKGDRSLVGKLFIDHAVGKEVISSTMAKIW